MRAGARMLYQRLEPAPSSLTVDAPAQRTRSGVIERSKWVNACSTWLKGCGSIAAARKEARTKAPAAVAVANSGRHHSPPHTPLSGRRSSSTLPSSCSATTMNTRRRRRARLTRGAGSSCCRPVRRAALGGVSRHAEVTRQHAPHVAIENREARSEGERENRARGRAPDAGKGCELRELAGKLPAVVIADARGRAMQVAGPRVIAEPRPQMQHLIDRCIGERAHVGEAAHETLKVGNDGCDLRLLQHDLGHPHAIRRAVLLPGKVVAPVAGVPLKERGGYGFGGDGHPRILAALRGAHRAHTP